MAVGDVWKVRFITSAGDQLGLVIRHYRVSAESAGGLSYSGAAARLGVVFSPLFRALMSEFANYRGTAVQRIFPTPPGLEAFDATGAGLGTVSGDLLPRQVSGIITLRTASAGRKFRGRSYVPFPSETSSDNNGHPTAGYVAGLDTLGASLTATQILTIGLVSTTVVPILWHRATSTLTDLVTWQSRPRWATQRRRGDYGAPNLIPV